MENKEEMITIPLSEYRDLVNFKIQKLKRNLVYQKGEWPRSITAREVIEWLKLYDEGVRAYEIGTIFGRSHSIVMGVIYGERPSRKLKTALSELASEGKIVWPRERFDGSN